MTVTTLSTSPPWCPQGHCYTEMDATLALGEAITKQHTITLTMWVCDLCSWFHIGARRVVPARCPNSRKRMFPTQELALEHLAGLMEKAAAGNPRREEKRVYLCPKCSTWHTTGMP